MNIFFLSLIIFLIVYFLLNWFVKTSSKKISNGIRLITIILSAILAIIMIYAGRFLFSLPFLLMILPLIKTKVGLSFLQIFRIWSLLRILKNSGRFNFNSINQNLNTQNIPLEEAYKILNLDPKKKYTKYEVQKQWKKIISRVHPDISPDCQKIASIVNEARDTILKNDFS